MPINRAARDEAAPELAEHDQEIAEVRAELNREDHERGFYEGIQRESWRYGWLGDPIPELTNPWETPDQAREARDETPELDPDDPNRYLS